MPAVCRAPFPEQCEDWPLENRKCHETDLCVFDAEGKRLSQPMVNALGKPMSVCDADTPVCTSDSPPMPGDNKFDTCNFKVCFKKNADGAKDPYQQIPCEDMANHAGAFSESWYLNDNNILDSERLFWPEWGWDADGCTNPCSKALLDGFSTAGWRPYLSTCTPGESDS